MRLRAVIFAVLSLSSGCRLHRVDPDPLPPVDIPSSYSNTGEGTEQGGAFPEKWWKEFKDETLDVLMERTLSGNLDLKAAVQRVKQAVSLAEKAGSPLFPSLSLEGSAAKTKQVMEARWPFKETVLFRNQFSVNALCSYELDIWGRIASLKDAAEMDALASGFDLQALAMSLSAEIATSYFNLVEALREKELISSQIETSRKLLKLLKLRFARGLATALDVYQQSEQLAALEALQAPVEERIGLIKNVIAVLQGSPPGSADDLNPKASLPDLPPFPKAGVPADLLQRRPDLKAEKARLVAADHRIQASMAEFLPTIRLSARGGSQATKASDLFTNWIWNLASSITVPLFQGGRMSADLELKKAQYQEKLQVFGRKFLYAMKEAEDAIFQEKKKLEYIRGIRKKLQSSKLALEEAKRRYLRGLTDYIPVLRSLSAFQSAQREMLKAKRDLIVSRVKLYQALGGDWAGYLPPVARGAVR